MVILRPSVVALAFWFALASHVDAAQLAACSAAQTTCSNDTVNDAGLNAAVEDATIAGTQLRVVNLFNQQCANIYSEAITTTGHVFKTRFCQAIAAGTVPRELLVSSILTAIIQTEILSGQGPAPSYYPTGGNMVDADVNTAIGGVLTVSGGAVATTGTTSSAVTTATAASGASVLTVASATGIVQGMTVAATGVPNGTTVLLVSGTSITISNQTTGALSATPVYFYQTGAGSFTVASATGLAIGQAVSGQNVPTGATVTNVNGTTISISPNLLGPLATTPLVFTLFSGLSTRSW